MLLDPRVCLRNMAFIFPVCFPGMVAGLPGLPGASAAAVVASDLRWGSGPATTPHLATEVESASARVGRRGEEEWVDAKRGTLSKHLWEESWLVFLLPGCATRKSRVLCLCCGQRGAPGLTAVLNVEEESTLGLEPVRMGTAVRDVQRYCNSFIKNIKSVCKPSKARVENVPGRTGWKFSWLRWFLPTYMNERWDTFLMNSLVYINLCQVQSWWSSEKGVVQYLCIYDLYK